MSDINNLVMEGIKDWLFPDPNQKPNEKVSYIPKFLTNLKTKIKDNLPQYKLPEQECKLLKNGEASCTEKGSEY